MASQLTLKQSKAMILWVTSPEFKIWVQGPVGRGAGALLLPDSGARGGGASSPRPLPGPSTLTRYPEGADIGPSLPERGGPGGPTSAGAPARHPAIPPQGGSPGRAAGRALTSGAHRAGRGERAEERPLCGCASPSPTSSVPGDPRGRLGRPPPACPGEAVAASE